MGFIHLILLKPHNDAVQWQLHYSAYVANEETGPLL